jgi:hypothetical protein
VTSHSTHYTQPGAWHIATRWRSSVIVEH